ncbi:MAG: HAD family phosphatase [Clostridia bacterium]|nr:HAD family phosphatase [Clostridia bacterium]
MIKSVIFDMDGLMFDTERLSTKGWIECGKELGINIDVSFTNSFKGMSRMNSEKLFKEKFGKDFDYNNARKIRTEYILKYIEEKGVPVKKGLYELLKYLKSKNIKCAVATSTAKELAEIYFEKTNIREYIEAFVYGDSVPKGKPEPDIFLRAAEMMKEKPENCLVFEDSPSGIRAGKNAGMTVVAVPDMIPLKGEILKLTDYCIGSLDIGIYIIDEICEIL